MGLKAALKVIGEIEEQSVAHSARDYTILFTRDLKHILTAYHSGPVSPRSVDIGAVKLTASAVGDTAQIHTCNLCGTKWQENCYRQCPRCYPPPDLKVVDDTAKSPSGLNEGTPSDSDRSNPKGPRIVCLCGSTRFTEEMLVKQWELTKAGYIVLSWCALPDSYSEGEHKAHVGDQEGVKEIVDEVHKRKIDLCDEVFVLNIGGYIGESTRSEIQYAEAHGKPVIFHIDPTDRSAQSGDSVDRGEPKKGTLALLAQGLAIPLHQAMQIADWVRRRYLADGVIALDKDGNVISCVDTPHNPGGMPAEEQLLVLEGIKALLGLHDFDAGEPLDQAIAKLREGAK